VFVFCPNCGTQNESAATPCTKCGFKLSGISVPKFRGTMMLNSDQTVQELIDEHKKKQAREAGQEPGAAAPAPGAPPEAVPTPTSPSLAPLSGLPGAPKSVLQPPRAATGASKRRMGGTMLGVAPQVGGVTPAPAESAPPAPARAPSPFPFPMPAAPSDVYTPPVPPTQTPVERSPGGLAGTIAMPVAATPATEPERKPAVAVEPVRTQPLAAAVAPVRGDEEDEEEEEEEPTALPAAPAVAEDEPRPRRVQATVPLEAQPLLSPESGASDSEPTPQTRPLRPLEIVLIVATCGLYGIVLLLKSRKKAPDES